MYLSPAEQATLDRRWLLFCSQQVTRFEFLTGFPMAANRFSASGHTLILNSHMETFVIAKRSGTPSAIVTQLFTWLQSLEIQRARGIRRLPAP